MIYKTIIQPTSVILLLEVKVEELQLPNTSWHLEQIVDDAAAVDCPLVLGENLFENFIFINSMATGSEKLFSYLAGIHAGDHHQC